MKTYSELAFHLFGGVSEGIAKYFTDFKTDLRRANMRYSVSEYVSISLFTTLLAFVVQLPILSFFLGLVFQSFMFGFLFSITLSSVTTAMVFFVAMNYPKLKISSSSKDLDNSLPFAVLYLSTIASSKLPLNKVFEIFSKFSTYDEISKQINSINEEVKLFGLDINTALERSTNRMPSKKFRELIFGMLSTIRSGADIVAYLREKAKSFMTEYRRSLYEYSHTLTLYIEIYLTALVLGAIFFTLLTAIVSTITRVSSDIVVLQFLMIFVFMPAISVAFLYLIKTSAPGGE